MITVSDVSLSFSEKPLFKDVNLKFTKGNCYGIIGANGAGKSTFLKLLSGELEKDSGEIFMTPGERMAVLKQDHFAFDEYSVKDTVMMGFPKLYEVSKERDEIYAKEELYLKILFVYVGKIFLIVFSFFLYTKTIPCSKNCFDIFFWSDYLS